MKLPFLLALFLFAVTAAGCKSISATITSLEVDDCVEDQKGRWVKELPHVDCETDGAVRLVKIFEVGERYDEFPGLDTLSIYARNHCPASSIRALYPTEEGWDIATVEQRRLYCFKPA